MNQKIAITIGVIIILAAGVYLYKSRQTAEAPGTGSEMAKPDELKTGKYDKKTLTKWEGEGAFEHLKNIKKSDAVYIYNSGSYLGPAVTVEIGYALALGKPIYARAQVKDITVTNFIQAVASPFKLLKLLKSLKKLRL